MLIPAIDLQDGRVVQLQQGERLALAFNDLDEWLQRFAAYPLVQVIALDAAKGRGTNDVLVARACAALPCRVGGGIRTTARAREMLAIGAREVIAGSALFTSSGSRCRSRRDWTAPASGLTRATASASSRKPGWTSVSGFSR